MLNLQQRIQILAESGKYMLSDAEPWKLARKKASEKNAWFTLEFIDSAVRNIALQFLNERKLWAWAGHYKIPAENPRPFNIGIVMAGNIPLVGYHDFLCAFISGQKQTIKLSSKDDVLLDHLVSVMISLDESVAEYIQFAPMLKGCDAYITTGSNNSARYFEYYFRKYPHLIRHNRSSIAILDGTEDADELSRLADDVYMYFGMGCRNVTKIYVPDEYDFLPLLEAFGKYDYVIENHKYKHNYDYNLAIHIINRDYYMTNGSILLFENPSIFSPVSQLHFEYYRHPGEINSGLNSLHIQCMVGHGYLPFGIAQSPGLEDYADGLDTLKFVLGIQK